MSRVEQIGAATLYLGDCREVLPTLCGVDAVVTDPPYGLAGSSGSINTERGKSLYENGLTDTIDDVREIYVPVIRSCMNLAAVVAVTPGTPHAFEYPKPTDILAIIQPAVQGMSKWGRPTWQPVLLYGRDPFVGLTIKPLTFVCGGNIDKNEHPCPKPIQLMDMLVERVSRYGNTILDPFMGSGTTGVACARLGRRFIGIEIEPRYFDIACRRIEAAYKQADLFVPQPATPKLATADLFAGAA